LRGSDTRGMRIIGDVDPGDVAMGAGILAILVLIVVVFVCTWQYYHPKTASWRQYCAESQTTYVPVTNCSTGAQGQMSCSTHVEAHVDCVRYEWRCTKGQDGTRICRGLRPEDGESGW